jgi:geranylgeranyl pyrophosphate synthase
MYLGARLAGDAEVLETPIRQFSRHLGIAFQILNDLKDWEGDDHNKLLAGGDVLKGRPTVLWALALTSLSEASQQELEQLVNDSSLSSESRFHRVFQLYREADVFEKARQLVDRYQQRAEEVADEIEPDELRRLMYYMVDTILEPPAESNSEVIMPTLGIATSTTVDRVS